MKITEHAIHRGQQRGIHRKHMELMECYGTLDYRSGGLHRYMLTRSGLKEAYSEGCSQQQLDKVRRQVMIGGEDGGVVTVYHR